MDNPVLNKITNQLSIQLTENDFHTQFKNKFR